ncbi:MAG: sulfite exporter TauE/SafE family protein [Bacteroidota bacterium]|nr:sulfite exporter TauE/SafE family protein [Bacteroidota bacterium]
MDWFLYPAIIAVGFLAGFINTLAGSGSLLTLPLLMFLGLPANVANGTNRIAILLQNVVGVGSFKQQNVLKFKDGLHLGLPAVAGSLLGASLAVSINEKIMGQVIGLLLVVMFFIIVIKPEKWFGAEEKRISPGASWIQMIIFFFIGIYGGFIQAGVGFFLLAGLVLGSGFDLVKANAVKVFIVLLYTPIALLVFIYHDQVNYFIGLILAIGSMMGAFVGSRVAVSWGPSFVRIILLLALLGSSLKLLGVFDFLLQIFSGA